MTAIERIKTRLSAHPEIRYSEGPNEIDVKPPDSSGVQRGLSEHLYGLHGQFRGLARRVHVAELQTAVVLRGNTETKWVVESLKDGKWTPDSETGLLLQPFWHSARIEYRQNNLLGRGESRVD